MFEARNLDGNAYVCTYYEAPTASPEHHLEILRDDLEAVRERVPVSSGLALMWRVLS